MTYLEPQLAQDADGYTLTITSTTTNSTWTSPPVRLKATTPCAAWGEARAQTLALADALGAKVG